VTELLFLGTGGAWRVPELNCDCFICREMRRRGESRGRTALLLKGERRLLIDCGPDISEQLSRHEIGGLDAVLITHEHGDHYLGLDELFSYKRTVPKGGYRSIPVYMTAPAWKIISRRFGYLVDLEVIRPVIVVPGCWERAADCAIFPFKTEHGAFATGSVGYLIEVPESGGPPLRVVYPSDFMTLPDVPSELLQPDYLVMQSFWLHEPIRNRPHHMSLQRALDYIRLLNPRRETFLVHIGDGDFVPGDPANDMAKKVAPKDPLRAPNGGDPYPVPRCQAEWQQVVDRITADYGLPSRVTVAFDGLSRPL